MNNFERRVFNFIKSNSMIEPGSTVLIGLSGGGDSIALSLVLLELQRLLDIRLVAVHVNHGIRKEAGDDESFVQAFCKEHDIPCYVVKKNVPQLSEELGMSEEEAGRKVRYGVFAEILKEQKADYIAVAHHQNDVAETLLMNLIRGTGLHGAGGIRAKRGQIIRPFLCVNRQEIEAYLKSKRQLFCHDATNDVNIYTRNIIRNRLIPIIEKEINPAVVAHLCSAALEFEGADSFVREKTREVFDELAVHDENGIQLDVEQFKKLSRVIRADIILLCLEKLTPNRKDITRNHVDAVLNLAMDEKGTAFADLPYNLVAQRSYDKLRIYPKDTKNSLKSNEEFEIPSTLDVGDNLVIDIPYLGVAHISILQYNGGKLFPTSAYTKWFDYDRIQGAVFRKRHPEDYILLEHGDGLCTKKISKLMTDIKIPKPERDSIYLLADGDNVLWVVGHRMSGAFKVGESTSKIIEIKIDNGGSTNG